MERKTRRSAFTLLELLMVVAILGILAIMLLPVVAKSKGRSKQIACLSQLKQIGLGFISYAQEHNDRFPFQVPVKEGGTLELIQLSKQAQDEVYYSYAHFQAVSNEVDEPKIFVCPSDNRTPAASMRTMRNDNLSYLIGVNAEFGKPDSLLAADRHFRVDGNSASIMKVTASSQLAWTSAGHEFKGNLLFAGGHVERTGNAGLAVAFRNPTGPVTVWSPTAESAAVANQRNWSGSGGSSSGGNSQGAMNDSERGFAMLQKFFDAPSSTSPNSGSRSASSSPQNSGPTGVTRSRGSGSEPEIAAAPTPTIEPKQTNRPALFASVAPPPNIEDPETPVTVETAGKLPPILGVLLEPEQCWWCWWLILGGAVLIAFFLGWLIYRRRRRATVDDWAPAWQVPQPPNHR